MRQIDGGTVYGHVRHHDAAIDPLIAIGYPHHSLGSGDGLLAYSVGQVLSDARASAASAVPYDAEVEVVIGGPAAIGMSGGGLFDHDGALLGVLVRATPQLQVESNPDIPSAGLVAVRDQLDDQHPNSEG